MELVSKIFETLEISQLALLQLGLVVVLALLLSTLLIKPILRTFEERENLSVKPIEESRRLLSEADKDLRTSSSAARAERRDASRRRSSRAFFTSCSPVNSDWARIREISTAAVSCRRRASAAASTSIFAFIPA
ncbi:hypothetical protein, partial [Candidatus Deferrimicrobium sp.]|uniref:hypothetical protein n=1 Tax=Candidatus Deferrimicrobium sp. TaxID=3060586 RepID=UPI002ED49C5D